MYKAVWLAFFVPMLILSATVFSVNGQNTPTPSITVTSPNGGEAWQLGSTQTVTWTSSGINYTRLDLVDTAGEIKVTNLANFAGNPGSVSWALPTNIPIGNYKMRISTCTSLPSKDNCNPLTADVYDLSDSYFSLTATSQAIGCSADSDCLTANVSGIGAWAGATFCDDTSLKLIQYKESPTCQSGTCVFGTSKLAVKEDCSASGKICDFSTANGGQYQCITGTPPTTCTLNAPITTRCICGSAAYGGGYNAYSGYSAGYCCSGGSNIFPRPSRHSGSRAVLTDFIRESK